MNEVSENLMLLALGLFLIAALVAFIHRHKPDTETSFTIENKFENDGQNEEN